MLGGCAGAPPEEEAVAQNEDALRTTYGDLTTTLEGADLDRWIAVRAALAAGLARLDASTFPNVDVANLRSVRIACSSTRATRKLRDCAWIVGGSAPHVDAATGALAGDARVYVCKIAASGSATRMLDVLETAGDEALVTPLPASGESFYDGLMTCFAGVAAAPPCEPPPPRKYVELGEYWAAADDAKAAAWRATGQKLAEGFDRVCGDSFCEGDYPDVTPLGLACAATAAEGHVASCSFAFALADVSVNARGRVRARTATKHCPISVEAAASALAKALEGDDPLNAKLPDKPTSIYDALVGCL